VDSLDYRTMSPMKFNYLDRKNGLITKEELWQ
jgi:hypothetical protein